jgi:acetyl-CoA acetyltransferase
MRKVAVVGVGAHPWGIFDNKSLIDMSVQVTQEALKDAGLQFSQLNAMYVGGSNYVPVLGRGMMGNILVDILGGTGMDIVTIHGGCAGSAMVYHTAFMEVASGRSDIVLAVGADKNPRGMSAFNIPEDIQDNGYVKAVAIGTGNPAYWAMSYYRRFLEYGTTDLTLAKLAVKAHKNGSINPLSRYKKVFTIEEVKASPLVADPLRLLHICPFSHGAAAAIFCSEAKARQLANKPVFIAATAMASQEYGQAGLETTDVSMRIKPTAKYENCATGAVWKAYKQAGIGPEDLSFVELGDTSVLNELEYMESFGFCKPGEADRMLDRGETEINGRLPINASGGFQSFGEATAAMGLWQICELVWQLRGQAGQRQVSKPKVGLCQVAGLGPNSGAAVLKI